MFRKDRDVTGYLERKVPGDIGREYDFVSKEQDLRLIDALEEIYAETGKILRMANVKSKCEKNIKNFKRPPK